MTQNSSKKAKDQKSKDEKQSHKPPFYKYCRRRGHDFNNCRRRPKLNQPSFAKIRNDADSTNTAFITTFTEDEERLLKDDIADVWTLDNGASAHMTYRRDWFTDFSPSNGETVVLGDGRACEIRGKGTVPIRKIVEGKWSNFKIENVLYVPSIKKSLFSLGVCAKRGYDIRFKDQVYLFSLQIN